MKNCQLVTKDLTPNPDWSRFRLLAASLLLVLLGLAASANSFHAPWHFDDEPNIIDNRFIRINALDLSSLLGAMLQDRRQNRPFSNLTFALNYYFSGQDVVAFHLVNVALHWAAGLLVFFILRLTFRRAGLAQDRRDLAALAAAAVWTIHPLHTQAVTYIVQRQTVMASVFTLGSLLAYLLARESRRPRRQGLLYGLAALSFILAAGSKEIAWVTPGLILIHEAYFYQDFSWGFLRRRWPALILGLILLSGFLVLSLRSEMWKMISQGYQNYPFTLTQRLLTEPRVLISYLDLTLWPLPSRLSVEHDPALSTSLLHPWTTGPALLFWIVLLVGALRFARRCPWFSFAVLWYLLNISLESSFIPLDLMFEHRLYLPSLALIVPLIAFPVFSARRVRWVLPALSLVAVMLLLGTRGRNRVWQTELDLWRDCARKTPFKASAFNNLGAALRELGEEERALAPFNRAVKLNPKSADGYINRGIGYGKMGRYELALFNFNSALAINPNLAKAFYNRGIVYLEQGQFQRAIADWTRAIQINPSLAQAYISRGNLYLHLGRSDQAQADFLKAQSLGP